MTPFELMQIEPFPLPKRLLQWRAHVAAVALITGVKPLYILAVLDRESNGRSPAVIGFDGHGRGLMQIDDRAHPSFCQATFLDKPMWSNPAFSILAGAIFLCKLIDDFGGDYWAAAAAYNAGPNRVRKALRVLMPGAPENERIQAVDAVTTKGNYASDVKRRMDEFQALCAAALNRKDEGNV